MSDALYQQIRQNLDRKSTAELKRIIAQQHTGDWSDDAIRAAADILATRPPEPDQPDDEPGTAPASSPAAAEPHPSDPRGQGVFPLTPEEITGYRSKIQFHGWIFCFTGAFYCMVILLPPHLFGWYRISPLAFLSAGLISLMLGIGLIMTGIALIRLNPGARVPGIVLSVLVLLSPFATNYHSLNPIIGLGCMFVGLVGIIWLGKRGHLLGLRPDQLPQATTHTRPNKPK